MHLVLKTFIGLVKGHNFLRERLFLIVLCKARVQESSAKLVYLFGILWVDASGEQRTLFEPQHVISNNVVF